MQKITNRFLELFYKISEIPRESGKEEKFADFLEMFAKDNNLQYDRDENNNVLIKKSGNKENNQPLILQAHMDMVCIKKENSNHNFEIDPIEVIRTGDILSAKDTSLGADQGVGLAVMLLILESKSLRHPDLECLFTTEEETTFNGVANFDYSKLNGKKLINLDHCKDHSIIIGCDADICNQYILEGKLIESNLPCYKIKISNVKGGNSGLEMERSKKSAIMKVAQIIQNLQSQEDVLICEILGGKSEGSIATSCECILKTKMKDIESKIIKNFLEDEIHIQIDKVQNDLSFSLEDSKKIINEILNLKQGVITNKDDKITSGNVGKIETIKNKVRIRAILRSLEEKELQKQNSESFFRSRENNFSVEQIYQDSAWLPNLNSELKRDYENIYYQVNGQYPDLGIAHGGLECSCISNKTKELDMISIGSNIEEFHTVNEKTYISSCEKMLKTLLAYLESESY